MTSLRTRILLADDHAVVRRGLRLVLDAEPDLQVVAEAADGLEALAVGLREEVDLAVLDVAMPGLTGLQVARELSTRRPELRSLLLSMHDSEQYLFKALRRRQRLCPEGGCRPHVDRGVPGRGARRVVPLFRRDQRVGP